MEHDEYLDVSGGGVPYPPRPASPSRTGLSGPEHWRRGEEMLTQTPHYGLGAEDRTALALRALTHAVLALGAALGADGGDGSNAAPSPGVSVDEPLIPPRLPG